MKHLSLFLMFVCFSLMARAQDVEPLKWFAGGSMNFQYSKSGDQTGPFSYSQSSSIFISLYTANQISEHWAIGIEANLGRNYSEFPLRLVQGTIVNNERSEHSYGLGVFGRYTFNPNNKFNLFLQPHVGYGLTRDKYTNNQNPEVTTDFVNIDFGADLGVKYNVTSRFGVLANVAGVSYKHTILKQDGSKFHDNSLDLRLRLRSLTFGLEYKF